MSRLTLPEAVVIGAVILAMSIIGSKLVAPYQISSGPSFLWRLNTITGDIRICSPGDFMQRTADAKAVGYSQAEIAAFLAERPTSQLFCL